MGRRDYGAGSITPRGPGRWQIRWFEPPDPITGKRRRRAETVTGTRRDAAQRLALLGTIRRADTHAITLGQLIALWRENAAHELSTARGYDEGVAAIPARSLALPIDEVDPTAIRTIIRHVQAKYGVHRARRTHATISGGLTYAWRENWITDNAARRVKPPPAPKRKSTVPTEEQVTAFVAAVADKPMLVAWLEVSAAAGGRRSEVLALTWANVNLDVGSVYIDTAVDPIDRHIKGTKTGNDRHVALGPTATTALSLWRDAAEDRARAVGRTLTGEAFVFSDDPQGRTARRPDRATKEFARIRKSVGVEGVRLHDLRHFVATRLLAAGVDPKTVSARLGHTRVATTTDGYAHSIPARDREAAALMERGSSSNRKAPIP